MFVRGGKAMHLYWSYQSRQQGNLRPGKSSGRATPTARLDRTIFVVFIILVLAMPALVGATPKHATVHRKVNLREQPTTDSSAQRLLPPGEPLELVSPEPTSGFHNVKTSSGESGFVWSPNIRVRVHPHSPLSPGTPTTSPAAGEATAVSAQWEKPSPAEESFGSCAAGGTSGSDSKTNERKNRIDVPTVYHAVQFAAVADTSKLTYPAQIARVRTKWTAADAKAIAQVEGAAVQIRGHLSRQVKPEGAESTNCGMTAPDQVDWHMYLTAQPRQPISNAIIVEATPRVRALQVGGKAVHANWSVTNLKPFVDTATEVRISGWLMFDPDHVSAVGTQRATPWEIHPITRIEVFEDGKWVDLDT